MTSKSLWMDIEVAPDAKVLDGAHECDVAIIGSGIAGISTAYELATRGKSVIVIDRGHICGGMTSRTSAHLAMLRAAAPGAWPDGAFSATSPPPFQPRGGLFFQWP